MYLLTYTQMACPHETCAGPSISTIRFGFSLVSSKIAVDFDYVLGIVRENHFCFQNCIELIALLVQQFNKHIRLSLWRSSSRAFSLPRSPLQNPFRPFVIHSSYDISGPSLFRLCHVFCWITKAGHFPEISAETSLILSLPVVLQRTPLKHSVSNLQPL